MVVLCPLDKVIQVNVRNVTETSNTHILFEHEMNLSRDALSMLHVRVDYPPTMISELTVFP